MKWIPVTERLPNEGGRYWCYLSHVDDLGISHFQWNCCYNEDTKTFSDRTLTDGEIVTHWIPLPPTPDESSTSVEEEAVNVLKRCVKNTIDINISDDKWFRDWWMLLDPSPSLKIILKAMEEYKSLPSSSVTGEEEEIKRWLSGWAGDDAYKLLKYISQYYSLTKKCHDGKARK